MPNTLADRRFAIERFTNDHGFFGTVHACAKDMSNRQYYRFATNNENAPSFIIMDAPPSEAPERFIAIANFLKQHQLRAPEIIAFDASKGLVLLEDFGNNTFTTVMQQDPSSELALYETAVDVLIHLRGVPKPFFVEDYSIPKLLIEVEVFIDWYWQYAKGNKAPEVTKKDFMGHWQDLFEKMPATPQTLVLRDYHCDNLMTIGDTTPDELTLQTCGLLDFQDALWGSVAYDFVSLVEDARRNVSDSVIAECAERFFKNYNDEEVQAIQTAGKILALGRHVKVLGVFARYALRQKNSSKCVHNPRLWAYCERLLSDPICAELAQWFKVNFPTTQVRK